MSAAEDKVKLWSARKVPFEFDKGYPYEKPVLDAMDTIENHTRIWFCRRGNEANYVLITTGSGRSNSDVGMKGGQQTCTINNDFIGSHELGHTLGLIHEQERSDRDNYIEVHLENIAYPNDFAKDPQSNNLTGYDPASVMHYPAPATGWGGLGDGEVWTMRWKTDPSKRLGGQVNADGWKQLTQLDIEGLNKLYDNIPGWSYQNEVPNVGTTDSPALTVFQNRLYLAWKGSSDQHIWWNSFDASNWAGQQQVPNVGTTSAPALAVFQNRLYLAWKGSSDQHIWWNSFDGSNWAGQQQVPNAGTTDNPALAVFKNKLYLVWKGSGDQHIWYADFDGSANPWSGQVRIAGFGTTNGPALAAGLQDKLYMTWKGSGDQHIWYADFTL